MALQRPTFPSAEVETVDGNFLPAGLRYRGQCAVRLLPRQCGQRAPHESSVCAASVGALASLSRSGTMASIDSV